MSRLSIGVLLLFLLAGLVSLPAAGSDLVLILDASGSMWGQVEGENKIVIARRVLGGLVDSLDEDATVGLVAYGHRREGDCADIETVVPIGPLDKAVIRAQVDGLNPKGKTPITASLEEAFSQVGESGATVVLVSDGLETCGGDPCAAARLAKEKGLDFLLHVIGFDVAGEDVSQLECAAQAGGGIFFSAENADSLSAALARAAAMTPEVPPGRLSVEVVANGELHDASVVVTDASSGEDVAGSRTYSGPETNPRVIPLPPGRYNVRVQAMALKGDIERRFEGVEIVDGPAVEKKVDFSTGTLLIGATRNGERSDVAYEIKVAGRDESVAAGRTYTGERSNPATVKLTSGTYDVRLKSLEIEAVEVPTQSFEKVVVEPRGQVRRDHDFPSGTLRVGTNRAGERVDSVVKVIDLDQGKVAASSRTYTGERSNPSTFVLVPGRYRVEVKELRGVGEDRFELEVPQGETVERILELADG